MVVADIITGGLPGGAPAECWEWQRARTPAGYGTASVDGRTVYAHRLSYETYVAPVPPGMHLDHLCRNRACWNPAHLEPVLPAENTRRGKALVTHCPSGHPLEPGNLRLYKLPRRECATCHRLRERERSRARRSATN